MSYSQNWPLSQDANKQKGICSVCFAVRQLKNRDGTVHRHGSRNSPCPGSDLPPLHNVGTTTQLPSSSQPNRQTQASTSTAITTAVNTYDVDASQPAVSVSLSAAKNGPPAEQQPFVPLSGFVIKHIPKSVRPLCAQQLTRLLNNIVHSPQDADQWFILLKWTGAVLGSVRRCGKKHNVASVIRKRISSFDSNTTNLSAEAQPVLRSSGLRAPSFNIADAVSSKLEDGNIRAAVRLLCSDDTPAAANPENLLQLQSKHPPPQPDRRLLPDPSATAPIMVDEKDVCKALRSFPAGSSGGPDGLRPKHLQDLVNCNESGGHDLLSSLTAFSNVLLSGVCPSSVMPFFFGGRLIALNKNTGGLRPIAIGLTLRRLAAKCCVGSISAFAKRFFSPHQLGVGIQGGCEAVVHTARRFAQHLPADNVIVKLDFSNAFNCIHRDTMLEAVYNDFPQLYNFCHLAYSSPSTLFFGDFTISSQEGTQQGDPLGPFLFCLSIHGLLTSLKSSLPLAYMDDFTIGGQIDVVASDVERIITEGRAMGLHLNRSKCEIIHPQNMKINNDILDSFVHIPSDNVTLLGAPLFTGHTLDSALAKCHDDLAVAISRLKDINSHDALILLRSSFSAPKVQHLLRCSPCDEHQLLTKFDQLLRNGISALTNSQLSDIQWKQASLPIKDGGLGIRSVQSLALPSFLASATGTSELQQALLTKCNVPDCQYFVNFKEKWCQLNNLPPVEHPAASRQSAWDRPGVERIKEEVKNAFSDDFNRRRLSAVSAPHSGDWLHALPISACGLRLDDEAIRVAVGLRLGVDLCIPHRCPCGELVDANGSHSLSCRKAFGRMVRHQNLNEIIYRAFVSANIPVTKEPSGLSRSDGKRPDGLSLIPWQAGKSVTWDVTVTHSLADSYMFTASTPGAAAEIAANRKIDKYADLAQSHIFQPLAFETLGALNESGRLFIKDLGRRITLVSGDPREASFLFQRLSVTVQRFNAVAFRCGFISPSEPDS